MQQRPTPNEDLLHPSLLWHLRPDKPLNAGKIPAYSTLPELTRLLDDINNGCRLLPSHF
jgi:hypothetical protein